MEMEQVKMGKSFLVTMLHKWIFILVQKTTDVQFYSSKILNRRLERLGSDIPYKMGYSIFHPYRGMDDQIFKNQYVLERMIVWLINPLELNLDWFNPGKILIPKKSPTRKKLTVPIYSLEKYTLA